MAIRTYGTLEYIESSQQWVFDNLEPHVSIKLKNVFAGVAKGSTCPHLMPHTNEICTDILWFISRYPLSISDTDRSMLELGATLHTNAINETERILIPDYEPKNVLLRDGESARNYQLIANDFYRLHSRYLLGDDIGLGKTLTAILSFLSQDNRPSAVVCQAHLPHHWERQIKRFTNLSVHIVKTRKAYNLPPADVYIFKYTSISGWVSVFEKRFFNSAVFDEIQELRHMGTDKYDSSKALSIHVNSCLGMSATPIYNYGNEIFNVLNIIKPGCLGIYSDFAREWCGLNGKIVINPKALGAYLRDKHLLFRRTRKEVGRELPPVNTIVEYVDYDEDVVRDTEKLTRQLAMTVLNGSFTERGQAARDLDLRLRQVTGVSKAKYVAAYVRMLLESGEVVLLAGWHREVYEIWLKELADFNPVMYTGSETPKQKRDSEEKFKSGQTNLFIISLRSGVGLDGLQYRCNLVVIGELDYSPKVHEQVIGRVDRDGAINQVTAIYLISEYGSDPPIIDLLGLKSSQSEGIVDPNAALTVRLSDDSRIKKIAESFLKSKNNY